MAKLEEINKIKINFYQKNMPNLINNKEILSYLNSINYFTAPSSSKRHGAWVGGNFDHSFRVTQYILEYTKKYNLKWQREESPYIIGMFHDICKSDTRTFKIENCQLKIKKLFHKDCRHSEKSLDMIKNGMKLDLTLEEMLCIYYHMGEHGEDYDYRVLMEKMIEYFPNIKIVQKADTKAASLGI